MRGFVGVLLGDLSGLFFLVCSGVLVTKAWRGLRDGMSAAPGRRALLPSIVAYAKAAEGPDHRFRAPRLSSGGNGASWSGCSSITSGRSRDMRAGPPRLKPSNSWASSRRPIAKLAHRRWWSCGRKARRNSGARRRALLVPGAGPPRWTIPAPPKCRLRAAKALGAIGGLQAVGGNPDRGAQGHLTAGRRAP